MIKFIKENIQEAIDGFKVQKTSSKFWYCLYLTIYFSCIFLSPELFGIYQMILFFMLFGYSFDGEEPHFIFFVTCIPMLCVCAFVFICIGISFVFNSMLGSFNNWLDKPKKEKKP